MKSKTEQQSRADKKLIAYAEYLTFEKMEHEIVKLKGNLLTQCRENGFDCRTGKDIDISQLVEKDHNIGKNNLWRTVSLLKHADGLQLIPLIRVVRSLTDLGLKEAKEFVESVK